MKTYKNYQKILICIIPFVAVPVLLFLARFISEHITLPPCWINMLFGINCPGCGLTRSVIALIHGDILMSLRQNFNAILAILICLAFYVEFALRSFGFDIRFPIHNIRYLYVLLAIEAIFTILRNIIPCLMPI